MNRDLKVIHPSGKDQLIKTIDDAFARGLYVHLKIEDSFDDAKTVVAANRAEYDAACAKEAKCPHFRDSIVKLWEGDRYRPPIRICYWCFIDAKDALRDAAKQNIASSSPVDINLI